MKRYLLILGGLATCMTLGCSDSTDVSKQANDAYHSRQAGPPPPPGAMTNHGPAVGPYAKTGGIPAGSGAPYSGMGSGPGQAPPGASK